MKYRSTRRKEEKEGKKEENCTQTHKSLNIPVKMAGCFLSSLCVLYIAYIASQLGAVYHRPFSLLENVQPSHG